MAELDRFPKHPDAPGHPLDGQLIVSLTSYPARFPSLHLTIKSLLDQTVRPDRILLWIAHEHIASVPDDVARLQDETFSIQACDDLRSFKKIIPALAAYPEAFIVTCDDDTYYPDTWLAQLVTAFDPAQPTIVCHRAHQLTYTWAGDLAPYREWRRSVWGGWTHRPRIDLLPTGNGGVLYPPGSLPPQTTDLDLIRKLSPTSDDVWLYFMWRRNGWAVRRAPGGLSKLLEWPTSSQTESLKVLHKSGKKDRHLQDMVDYFGLP